MKDTNIKIKSLYDQLYGLIRASGLPVNVLYFMIKSLSNELETLFNSVVEKERIEMIINSQGSKEVDGELIINEVKEESENGKQ